MCKFKVHSLYDTATSMITVAFGLLMNVISVYSKNWMFSRGSTTQGLYQYCYEDIMCLDLQEHEVTRAIQATRSLAMAGMWLGVLELLLAPAHIVHNILLIPIGRIIHRPIGGMVLLIGLLAGLCDLLALLVWGIGVYDAQTCEVGQGMIYMMVPTLLLPIGGLGVYRAGEAQYKV